MYKLIIEDEEGHTTIVPLVKDEITIGRNEGNTIRLMERNISRHHARLIKNDGSVFIEDLDSYNGVKVNGDKIEARTNLQEGDLIEIGDYNFALQRIEDDPPWKSHSSTEATVTRELVVDQQDRSTAVMRLPVEETRKSVSRPAAVSGEIELSKVGRLVVNCSKSGGTEFELDREEMVIGSDQQCDINLSHPSVSASHAKVVHDGTTYLIVALDETLPIMVNGQRYARVALRSGDLIELGQVELRYIAPDDKSESIGEKLEDDMPTEELWSPVSTSFQIRKRGRISATIAILLILAVFGSYLIYRLYRTTRTWEQEVQKADTVTRSPVKKDEVSDQGQRQSATEDYNRGVAKMETRDFDGAVASFRAALGKDPQHADASNLLNKVLREQEAQRLINEVKKAFSNGRYDRAWSLLSSIPADTTAAREASKIKPELEGRYGTFHLQEASQAKEDGDLDEAIRHLDLVLALDKNNAFAKHLKKSVLWLQRKKLRAKAKTKAKARERKDSAGRQEIDESSVARIGKRNHKNEIPRLMTNAMHAFQRERYKESISILKKVIWLDPGHCAALKNIATSYVRDNQLDEAETYYQKFVDVCPLHEDIPRVRLFLKQFQEKQDETQ